MPDYYQGGEGAHQISRLLFFSGARSFCLSEDRSLLNCQDILPSVAQSQGYPSLIYQPLEMLPFASTRRLLLHQQIARVHPIRPYLCCGHWITYQCHYPGAKAAEEDIMTVLAGLLIGH